MKKQEAPTKKLAAMDDEDQSCGKFVRAPQKSTKKKKPKKAQVKIEYEMETEQPTRQRVKN